ncbi:GIY-YIG nuclease family protein [Bacillus cereus]|uniref:GIY-YIG nuclease family protein n=1 Tax=Bacillus cereus group TaxID=86661 RepID=UPI0007F982DC|nr:MULTISPECIES: GIY-YIG nuclease family protein [Bacillus cereus group]ARV91517.1 hypothetical protein BJG91_02580 [Bacillus thuringiensis]MDZ4490290.1 GIY-YIG nuclease family protein [Bacillus cereus]MDZ4571712.1 GIY-YIG nuclease family protein [Bacillus cereus]MDZ4636498.1 GIY-YIG nuclease family protein [Bacillus cereus]MEB9660169.1 GIY-YIG nuclease family protein [Bacillus cereus]
MEQKTKIHIKIEDTNSSVKELHRTRLPKYTKEIIIDQVEYRVFDWNKQDPKLEFLNDFDNITGVYVVYSHHECMYVGETGYKLGIRNRLRYHEKYKVFMEQATHVICYKIEDTKERLLFERVKISQLSPILNADKKGQVQKVQEKYESITEDRVWDALNEIASISEETYELAINSPLSFEELRKKILDYGFTELNKDIMKILRGEEN